MSAVTQVSLFQLKHSWLENQLLSHTQDDVVYLWRLGPWAALGAELDGRLEQVRQLAGDMVEEFSPAKLIDECRPLSVLPEELKAKMRVAVTCAYLTESRIEELREELLEAIRPVDSAARELREAWKAPRSREAEKAVRLVWGVLRARAEALRRVVDQIPREVYLP